MIVAVKQYLCPLMYQYITGENKMSHKSNRLLLTLSWALLIPAVLMVMLVLSQPPRVAADGQYFPYRSRFGFAVTDYWGRDINDYPNSVRQLNAGWYLDWTMRIAPDRPNGMEFVQLIWISGGLPNWASLAAAIAANRGSWWLISNEPDRQDVCHPRVYAARYHDIYAFIKGHDPTAMVAPGGIVQATPLRLRYLDDVIREYRALYGQKPPADAWHIHEQILRETYNRLPGCSVPVVPVTCVITYTNPPGYMVRTLPLYCTNPRGEMQYCIYDQYGRVPVTQTRVVTGEVYDYWENASLPRFIEHIRRFRQWMKDRGYREKPLVISEFGVIYPSWILLDGDESVKQFMRGAFQYLVEATDPSLGCPADGDRLVQRWNWWGLNQHDWDHWGGNGALAKVDRDELTIFGPVFAEFTHIEPPYTMKVTPQSGWSRPGTWQYFTSAYRDADGWRNIRYTELLVGPTYADKTKYAYVRYDVQANRMYLYHPVYNWTPAGGKAPGSAYVARNQYARLDIGGSSVVTNSDTVTVTWKVWFTFQASGHKNNLYAYVEDVQGHRDGFDDRGDWTVNAQPSIPYLCIEPEGVDGTCVNSVQVGRWYEFITRYADPDGRTTLDEVYLLITTSWARTQYAVYLKYDQSENKMYLRNAADTAWLGPITPKSSTALQNEYCILRGDWSRTGAYDSKTLTVRWWLRFKPAFRGRHNIYMRAIDNLGPALNGATGLWLKGSVEVQ